MGTATAKTPTSVERNGDSPGRRDSRRQETPLERLDRNMVELTGELRVVVTGVQMLFAFLLIVPFNVGFRDVGSYERTVYFVTLLLVALAAACTIAPSAHHRFLFRHDDKRHIVFVSNRVILVGLGFLALSMCGCLLLVATKLFGQLAGALTLAGASVPFLLLWFAMPLWRRAQIKRHTAQPSDAAERAVARERQ